MSKRDPAEARRLTLQIARDATTQAQLQTLLTTVTATVADKREELRTVTARMKRTGNKSGAPVATPEPRRR